MKLFPNSLKYRVSLYLTIALWTAIILFLVLVARHHRDDVLNEVSRHVVQVSELIVKSTRYAMLVNKRDIVEKIIDDIGRQKGIERVRVLMWDGTIIHSNRPRETGYSLDQTDKPCVECHKTGEPLEHVPDEKRWHIFENPDGRRSLGTMSVIRNEPACSNASCHEHPASQKVLGVVDIAYSLDEIDGTISRHVMYIGGLSLALVIVVSLSVGILLQRLIYVPLKDLESGAKKISSGSLDHRIPVRRDDEFAHVADSFNHMTAALQNSQRELLEWVQTLESKVEQRTQELLVAEAAVAQGEKLAAVGLLASGVAHELNNPLTGILTFTSLLRKKMPDGSQDAEDLDLVIGETKRCAAIIKRLLDFSREKVPLKGFFDLNRLIEETVRFIDRPAALMNIDVSTDLEPDLPQVWGDADMIKQVLLNMLVNAEQAIEGHGNVIVQSRRHSDRNGAPMVEIAIRDTGCGIPEANLQKIFDPFFTSKEIGKGTGLGLSVSYGIVKAHGGDIVVESEVGAGTVFRVHLPVMPASGEDTK